jgi:uncharacterized protein YndB with AHSA1/START domain
MAEPAVVVERIIKARPELVFTFFTDPTRWLQWQGVQATLDPRPGGVFRVNVDGGDGWASGHFVELDPPRRLVFTWGWELAGNPVQPGSSTVTVELIPDPAGTLVRLTHSDLPAEVAGSHADGWEHYLPRLALAVEGGDPGPDSYRGDSPAGDH